MKRIVQSAYDAVASAYERYRELPAGVPDAIRSAVRASADVPTTGRVLDVGAGTGRVGRAFVAAGDRYVGVDASHGMLGEFAAHLRGAQAPVRLAQADGEQLPFPDGLFDVVLMIHVLSGARGGRRLLADAQRVLRPAGALVVGRTIRPDAGVDGRMKQQLTAILAELGIETEAPQERRSGALSWLESTASEHTRIEATSWMSQRTPRHFLDQHQTGHRFSQLPEEIRHAALTQLSAWAAAAFGSLDAVFSESHLFELQIFKFQTQR